MAFRTGSYVHKIGERLCPAREQSESWTYIFAGMNRDNASDILAKFHEEKVSHKSPPKSQGIQEPAPCAQHAGSRQRARTGEGRANGGYWWWR